MAKLIDSAPYNHDQVPDRALSQIWCQESLSEQARVALATAGVRSVQQMRFLGDEKDPDKLIQRAKRLISDWPREGSAEEVIAEVKIQAIWDACRAVHKTTQDIEQECRKDPSKIVEIGDTDRGKMWQAFRKSIRGREILLTPNSRPDRSFIEIVRRDHRVHGVIQKYTLNMIYLEADGIRYHKEPAMQDDFLKWKAMLAPVPVGDLQNVDNRIQALWITVDLVGACNFDYDSGPVRLIHEIKKRREQVADAHTFTVMADAMIREKIHELQYLEGDLYPDLKTTITHVIDHELDRLLERAHHQNIRADAKNMIQTITQDLGFALQPYKNSMVPGGPPISQHQTDSQNGAPNGAPSIPKPEMDALKAWKKAKRDRQKVNQKAKRLAAQAGWTPPAKGWQPRGKGGFGKGGWPTWNGKGDTAEGKGKGKGSKTMRPRIPPDEFKKLTAIDPSNPANPQQDICRWWNSSQGCPNGACQYKHDVCILCKKIGHRWCDKHYTPI